MRTYQVLYKGEVIAESECQYCDVSMGVLSGRFVPLPAYDKLRPIFARRAKADLGNGREDQDTLRKYFDRINDLNLKIRRSDGHLVDPVGLTIHDFSWLTQDPDAYLIEILGCDRETVDGWLNDHPDEKLRWESSIRGDNPDQDED
jgi:hypothetical protein